VTRGKPWPPEDEKLLRNYFDFTKDLRVIAFNFDGKYSEDAIRLKLIRLGLIKEVVGQLKNGCTTTSKLELPDELPSVEEALKTLAAALEALDAPGLGKSEVLRLRNIISGAKVYKELLADYVNYRGLEAELLELRQKYAELAKKSQGTPP
jgi:CRISPR/Cas system-associated endonuclease/helicase Cas3